MIGGDKVLGVITARGGSKGLPQKNIRMVGGKPLLAWTIAAAKASKYLDRLIVSTDDDAIRDVALSLDCEVPFKRERGLASDEASSVDTVLDALTRCPGYAYVVLLQPTSPLRSVDDIDGALEQCDRSAAPACVSVCRTAQSPYWMFTIERNRLLKPLLPGRIPGRRQELPPVFVLNGAVYVARAEWLRAKGTFLAPETVAYEMPVERSIDVDSAADLKRVDSSLQ